MPTSALPRVGGREQKKKTGWEKERKKDEMQSKGVEGLRVCGFARAVGCRLLPSSPACSALSVVGTRETPVCCKHHPERGLRWPLRRVWGSVRPKRWDGRPRSGLAASAQATSTKFRRTFPVPHLVHLRANSFPQARGVVDIPPSSGSVAPLGATGAADALDGERGWYPAGWSHWTCATQH